MPYSNHIYVMAVKFGINLTLQLREKRWKYFKRKPYEQCVFRIHVNHLRRCSKIVDIQNYLIVHSFLKGKLPKSFENFFQKCSDIHISPTRFSSSECFYLPPSKSVTYGMKSITNHCIYSWNTLTENLDKPSTHPITTVKKSICNNFIANY